MKVRMLPQEGEDWCHLCGTRKDMKFATFDIPENAEHNIEGNSRYFRVCMRCMWGMYCCAKEQQEMLI